MTGAATFQEPGTQPHQFSYREGQHPRPNRPPYHPHVAVCVRRNEEMCSSARRSVVAGLGSVLNIHTRVGGGSGSRRGAIVGVPSHIKGERKRPRAWR